MIKKNLFVYVVIFFSVSGCTCACVEYLKEFTTEKHYSQVIVWSDIVSVISPFYLSVIGLLFLPHELSIDLKDDIQFRPWRIVMLVYKLPGVIAVIGLLFMKESPKYHLSFKLQGNEEEPVVSEIEDLGINQQIELFKSPFLSIVLLCSFIQFVILGV